jgi:hypothetical protein
MITGATIDADSSALCSGCGLPVDSQYFDDSSVQTVPQEVGDERVLARFDLPAQYCGVLEYFTQFTDAFGTDNTNIATPEIEWQLLVNNHALFPYINLRRIVNPWGHGNYAVNIRLEENSTLELVARRVQSDGTLPGGTGGVINFVGGRIAGRFWYNASCGDAGAQRR